MKIEFSLREAKALISVYQLAFWAGEQKRAESGIGPRVWKAAEKAERSLRKACAESHLRKAKGGAS